ncbi:MarR family winged helix-turn-helix transcriptional regulator [Herbiconiux sp. SYSU D00978]|uniref:MarR family winged helix-turn-helix transcriptional regulator n=1 Tax=Herbiconiux sp. SYSU D00978 TaxID=2812562 RepID=UPI0027DCAE81|nr:MarR family transcriptional regulator [Herbiconiux sp. SYSU D00978]
MSDRALAIEAWEALFRAQVSVMRTLNAEFPEDQISFNEYDVLFNLSTQPERQLRIRDLNKHLLLTQPSVSRMVDRLAARGIVVKLNDPTDARGIIVRMTEHGYDVYRRVAAAHGASIADRVGSRISADEMTTLIEICRKLKTETR